MTTTPPDPTPPAIQYGVTSGQPWHPGGRPVERSMAIGEDVMFDTTAWLTVNDTNTEESPAIAGYGKSSAPMLAALAVARDRVLVRDCRTDDAGSDATADTAGEGQR